ncbi:hypothetical protein RHSIM_Rhsim01G0056800 [Rhododendron simsii]|uniref:Uncharacterized protein n=1 Tax=Rhododendron simsii TaxID=118357 RepID=A0A834HH69_RHOSS|nr:hypothetical protein RHSIM_Rhsim01G0056800 [Rhododendron simsii]
MAESLSKPVQELIVKGGELPEKYIYKKGENAATDVSYPPIEVPVIDLSLLASQSTAGEEELRKLRSALGSCGCIQAINHGMTASFLDQVHEIGKQFFALPIDEKQKYSRTVGDIEGFHAADSVLSEHQTLDWTDRLFITIYPEDKINLRFWPENPENFREILNEYTRNLSLMKEFLLKSMAKSLNIEEDCFLKQYGEGAMMVAGFNFYLPCPRPDLTVYLSTVYLSTIMSNGMFKSPMHRVVTNSERERLTLAVFCHPDAKMEIGPVEELIDEKRPRLYKTMKDYVAIYFENDKLNKRPIDAVTI